MNKLFIVTLSALMLPTVAFAEVTFQDITDKMKIGDVSTAEMLTKQILKDKPGSAKAHYYMGQILATEGDYKAAYKELNKSADLDKSLGFASSPEKFRAEMDKVKMNLGKIEAPEISNHEENSHWFLKLLIWLGFGGLIYWIYTCRPKDDTKTGNDSDKPSPVKPNPAANHPAYASSAPEQAAQASAQPTYRPTSNPSYQPSYGAPHVANNYNSSNDGLVTGVILGEMMSSHGSNNTIIDRQTIIERDTTNNIVRDNDFDAGSNNSSKVIDFDSGSDSRSSSDFDSGSDNSSSFDSGSLGFDSGSSGFDSGGSSFGDSN